MRIVRAIAFVACIATLSCSKQPAQPPMTNDNQAKPEGLFLSWKHPLSNRHAILEEVNGTVWLYLSATDSPRPERDCPAFSIVPPPEQVDWKAIAASGLPPPISRDIASPEAHIPDPRATDFGVEWSADGTSVALLRSGRMICMIVAGEKRGRSRALAKEGPLGLPFDEALALRTFPKR